MDGPYILVTFDNKMVTVHADVLRECQTTLAIIDNKHRAETGLTEVQYWHEVIHRHAHRLICQEPKSIKKYRCSSRITEVKL